MPPKIQFSIEESEFILSLFDFYGFSVGNHLQPVIVSAFVDRFSNRQVSYSTLARENARVRG
jgi:hypothetical protein